MRIAIVSELGGSTWGGSEEAWYQMVLRALQNGHTVSVCAQSGACLNQRLSVCRESGGKVMEWHRGKVARLEWLYQFLRPNFSRTRLGNPDVVLVSLGALTSVSIVPGLLAFLKNQSVPTVLLCQFNAEALAVSPQDREDVREVFESVNKSVFVAEENRVLAERQFAVSLTGADIISNPIREWSPEPLPMPTVSSKVIWACVARIETLWKGQDLLLQVLAAPKWRARDWRLKFFGTGRDLGHVQRVTDFYGLSDRVTFAGHIASVREIWQESHVMVLPSRGEGTPLAILEAMACGRPVVTTNVGGNAGLISDGVSGWIAEAATPRLLDEALERSWTARAKWSAMGLAARAGVENLQVADPQGQLLNILIETASQKKSKAGHRQKT